MTYELWDLVSRNMIDWFEDQREAVPSVQAYVDAGEAGEIMLLVRGLSGDAEGRVYSGGDLVAWLNKAQAELRRAS